MAPKKKETQKMSMADFMNDSGFGGGSWADEVEETYVAGTQPLPAPDRPRPFGGMGGGASAWQDRGYQVRDTFPQQIPDKPPYTAHLGNLSYDATNETVTEFFEGCQVVSVRIIEDREMMRPKGFGYVEFVTAADLEKALTFDGQSFQGRMVKIKIADPPRGGDRGDSSRDLSDWSRKGPLPDLPSSRSSRQFGGDFGRGEGGERRPPREMAPPESRAPREINWERRGPLAPLPQQEAGPGSRDGSRPPRQGPEGMGERSERGSRRGPATWGEGREEGSRPPRRDPALDRPERPARVPSSAAEKDHQWRERMRTEPAGSPSQDGSEAPTSPTPSNAAPVAAAAPASRPKLNLAKRTVSEAPDAGAAAEGASKGSSPFGAARPIDTATREKQVEEKRQQAIIEKKEADDKAKEDRRLAKEAAAKAAAEAKEKEAEAPAEGAEKTETTEEAKPAEETAQPPNGDAAPASPEQKMPVRTREPREPKEPREPREPKSRAAESSSWRTASGEGQQRPPRGPPSGPRGGRGGAPRGNRGEGRQNSRQNGNTGSPSQAAVTAAAAAPAAAAAAAAATSGDDASPVVDADGWTTVPNKKGRPGRA